ncbi:MAG: polysaccharide biosynthesis tyrosine autokinase [Gemmatimonadaceae bacterium]|nr:polysaccharide biosynthesis tyrosine autokinase [Gemmatimonadaceae bacterium]
MSGNLVPSSAHAAATRPDGYAPPLAQWGGPPAAPPSAGGGIGDQIARSLAAIKRYKWLILVIISVGTVAGFFLTRVTDPMYFTEAKVWVQQGPNGKGIVAAPGASQSEAAWIELVRSFQVLDRVAANLGMQVKPTAKKDLAVLRTLVPTDTLQAGAYRLDVDGANYTLKFIPADPASQAHVMETGTVGDTIGRTAGFVWQPTAEQLAGTKRLEFSVVSYREAAIGLARNLTVILPLNSNLMRVQLTGEDPKFIAAAVNQTVRDFTAEADRLKRLNLEVTSETVEEHLRGAAAQLNAAQAAYESFKVNTITQPSENVIATPGISSAMNPVFQSYFSDKSQLESARRDREALQRVITDAKNNGGRVSIETLRGFPALMGNNPQLGTALNDLALAQATLRKLQLTYTEAHPFVKDAQSTVERLETQTIPQLVNSSLVELSSRESEMQRRVDGASVEMKKIPARTIQEMQLKREVDIAASMYADLAQRAVGARLAERSVTRDLNVLDTAVAPRFPTSDTTTSIFIMAVLASIGAGLALALLLDRLDRRFRYPDQATNELGLDIVGAIPTYRNTRRPAARLEEATQLVEAFRSIALSVRHAFEGIGPVQLTISSPGPGDGKSFTSANLSSALADSGFRTVIVDGDIRRGELHTVFGEMDQAPGLIDYLSGEATLEQVVRPTQHHANLFVVPCGKRRKHGPELLASERMREFLDELRARFDAIIVDSAPLGAGIDAFALGAATGSMLVVLRAGETDRKLAQAKLTVLDRMPVRIIGAILNDIGVMPQFKYYYYLEGYHGIEGPEHANTALLGAGGSKRG